MVHVSQIRDRLIDFLAVKDQEGALASFEEWLAESSWNMHLDSDIQAQKFVGEIQLYLAEMDAENRDYDWLLKKFRSVLTSFPIQRSETQFVSSGSSTVLKFQKWAFEPFGSPRAAAFGSQVPH